MSDSNLIQNLFDQWCAAADEEAKKVFCAYPQDKNGEHDHSACEDAFTAGDAQAEPIWAEHLTRLVADHITDLMVSLGGFWTPESDASCARQAWFGEDFNYPIPGYITGAWNSAFLYNASEGMLSMIRAVNYEFARRGYLPPHAVGKNSVDFREGGELA